MRWTCLLITLIFCAHHSQAQVSASGQYQISLPDTLQAYVDRSQSTFLYFYAQSEDALGEIANLFDLNTNGYLKVGRAHAESGEVNGIVLLPFDPFKLELRPNYTKDWLPVVYVVKKKETIFKIAKRYFHLGPDELMTLNNMQTTNLKIGQRLRIGWIQVSKTYIDYSHTMEMNNVNSEKFTADEAVIEEVGVATWNKDSGTSDDGLYVMHRTAKVNSYMELTNPMFNTKVVAKVIGRIPVTYRNDVQLIVSPASARKLHVLDPRFRVKMRFVE